MKYPVPHAAMMRPWGTPEGVLGLKFKDNTMLTLLMTFFLTSLGYGTVVFVAVRRVLRHARSHPEAMKALVEHVLIPMVEGKAQQSTEAQP